MVPISHDLVECAVGYEVSHCTLAKGFHVHICITARSHVFVAFERPFVLAIDRPKSKARDDDTLHLFGDIVGCEGNLLYFRWELHPVIKDGNECLHANPSFKEFPIPDDEQPLIRLAFYPSVPCEECNAGCSDQ